MLLDSETTVMLAIMAISTILCIITLVRTNIR